MGEPVMRDWIYRSGDIFLPRRYVDMLDTYIIGNPKSIFYINYWTFLHALSGVVFALLWKSKTIYLDFFIAHSLWELWQILIGMTPLNTRGAVDITVDTLAGFVGVYLVKSIATMTF
jgi:hypothetical protein